MRLHGCPQLPASAQHRPYNGPLPRPECDLPSNTRPACTLPSTAFLLPSNSLTNSSAVSVCPALRPPALPYPPPPVRAACCPDSLSPVHPPLPQGGILSGEGGDEVKDILLLDVCPLSMVSFAVHVWSFSCPAECGRTVCVTNMPLS